VERTRAGLRAAKRRGVKLGRKPTLTEDQIAHARRLIDGGESPRVVAKMLRVHRSTLYRHIPAGSSEKAA
jgi:DNA invertase Pin-like site-specific DNA recombinase